MQERPVKVLVYGNMWTGSLEASYARAFAKLGWVVSCFDPQAGRMALHSGGSSLTFLQRVQRKLDNGPLKPLQTTLTNHRFARQARLTRPDLIYVVKGAAVTPACLRKLRADCGCPVFVYHPDNPFITSAQGWNRHVLACLPLYDCHLTFGKFLIPEFARGGARRVEYLPFACDPELHGTADVVAKDDPPLACDVAFMGTWDSEREYWLSLLARRFRVSIWGNEWENCREPALSACWQRKAVYGRDFARICRLAPLSFNFVRTENNRSSHNMRTFEIPACGGLALTNQTEEQLSFFKQDEEILCFASEDDLLAKVGALLAAPERISVMKRNAQNAVQPHTYQKRAEQMIAFLQAAR